MTLPAAIIFVNADINSEVQSTLVSQLFINDTMSFDEFNARVASDPNYPTNIHLQNLRILVILTTLQDLTNRTLADVVLFYNQGQVTVEKNNFGPPGLSRDFSRINIYDLLRYNGSPNVVILPFDITAGGPEHGNYKKFPFGTPSHPTNPRFPGPGGIVADQLADTSGVYAPNPDNEYNNPDFIKRK